MFSSRKIKDILWLSHQIMGTLCLWYSNMQHEQEHFSWRSSSWSSARGHPAVARGKLQHSSRPLSMIWELIWPWGKKIMHLWEECKGGRCWELLSSLESTWSAKGYRLNYRCRCNVGRSFNLSSQSLFLLTQTIGKGVPGNCRILVVVGTRSFLPLSKGFNLLSSRGVISGLIISVGRCFLFFRGTCLKSVWFSLKYDPCPLQS